MRTVGLPELSARKHLPGSLRSAQVVVPMVLELTRPRRVVDVGCGLGAWLSVFQEQGIRVLKGLDQGWAVGAFLLGQTTFVPTDLARPFWLEEEFDLAVCLEVAEHLPESSARGLVESLTRSAPAVLFSAAVPGQGGAGHLNEQWPSFWTGLFAAQDFVRIDAVRPRIWRDDRVEWWYRHNLFLYVRRDRLNQPNFSHLARMERGCFGLTRLQSVWLKVDGIRCGFRKVLARIR